MKITRRIALAGTGAAALAAVLAACGSDNSSSTSSSSASASSTGSSASSSGSSDAISQLKPAGRNSNGYQITSLVENAPVVTLYTDYQCPYCAKAEPNFEKAAAQLQGTLNVTVKNFPLPMHANAVPAAYAVMAAEQQDKRIEFGDKLFETQADWEEISDATKLLEQYKGYAQELGLDTGKFATDFANTDLQKIVEDEFNEAKKMQLSGTPSFVVNGKEATDVTSAMSADEMVAAFKKLANV